MRFLRWCVRKLFLWQCAVTILAAGAAQIFLGAGVGERLLFGLYAAGITAFIGAVAGAVIAMLFDRSRDDKSRKCVDIGTTAVAHCLSSLALIITMVCVMADATGVAVVAGSIFALLVALTALLVRKESRTLIPLHLVMFAAIPLGGGTVFGDIAIGCYLRGRLRQIRSIRP